jgi:divinyl protochlorophyllide a 8-vinyl-reductase
MVAALTIESAGHRAGMIGPNAITRVIEALDALEGRQSVQRIFGASRLEAYLFQPPTKKVDEAQVKRLHQMLHADLGDERARAVGRFAGKLTADYLLRYRIPLPAQIALRCCPTRLASRMLAKAIAGNAWTFVGTGSFSARHGHRTTFTIRFCPICQGQRSAEPYCDFYAGTFVRLYACLVNKGARVTEIGCQAMGAPACTFEIVNDH